MDRRKTLEGLHYVCISDYMLLSQNEKLHDNASSLSAHFNEYYCLILKFQHPLCFAQ
jgi:hypothetical protein